MLFLNMKDLILQDPLSLAAIFNEPIYVIAEDSQEISTEIESPMQKITTPVKDETTVNNSTEIVFNYIGKYEKNILILVNDPSNEVSSEDGKVLLKNIIKHLNIGSKDFAILNVHKYNSLSFSVLKEKLNPSIIFSFGIQNENNIFPIDAPNYFKNNGTEVFMGESLNIMANDVNLKKAFLITLKNYTQK